MSYLKKQPENNFKIPHVVIGNKLTSDKPSYTVPMTDYRLTKEQIWLNRIKEWGFYLVVTLIVIYATYRLIRR